jgi:hypothetical protein
VLGIKRAPQARVLFFILKLSKIDEKREREENQANMAANRSASFVFGEGWIRYKPASREVRLFGRGVESSCKSWNEMAHPRFP